MQILVPDRLTPFSFDALKEKKESFECLFCDALLLQSGFYVHKCGMSISLFVFMR